MFSTGDIVLVKNNESKKNKLYLVLFTFENDTKYVCTCKIIDNYKHLRKKDIVYLPYQILNSYKHSCITIKSSNIYEQNELVPTGLKLNNESMLKVFEGIINYESKNELLKEHYEFVKTTISEIKQNLDNEEAKRKKEDKKLRKLKRQEAKRNYNNIKNK